MLDGSPPQIRRVLAGQEAHESLLVYFYLGEILTLQEVLSKLPSLDHELRSTQNIADRFKLVQQSVPDPLHHLQNEILQVFLPSAIFVDAAETRGAEVCELGCSFFSAIDKIQLACRLLDASVDLEATRFSAIDHSEYFLRGAVAFHSSSQVDRFVDYSQWAPAAPYPLLVSRFVASYATNSTEEIANWIRHFAAFHIIDVINLEAADFITSNNGLRQTFLNLPALVERSWEQGWTLYINEVTPDFNSGRRCAVIKLFGIRTEIEEKFDVKGRISSYPELGEIIPMIPLTVDSAHQVIASVDKMKTLEEWEALAAYKQHFPIWGKPLTPIATVDDVNRLIRSSAEKLDLVFESGQINFYVDHALGLR